MLTAALEEAVSLTGLPRSSPRGLLRDAHPRRWMVGRGSVVTRPRSPPVCHAHTRHEAQGWWYEAHLRPRAGGTNGVNSRSPGARWLPLSFCPTDALTGWLMAAHLPRGLLPSVCKAELHRHTQKSCFGSYMGIRSTHQIIHWKNPIASALCPCGNGVRELEGRPVRPECPLP